MVIQTQPEMRVYPQVHYTFLYHYNQFLKSSNLKPKVVLENLCKYNEPSDLFLYAMVPVTSDFKHEEHCNC